jgi:hypothetical protein
MRLCLLYELVAVTIRVKEVVRAVKITATALLSTPGLSKDQVPGYIAMYEAGLTSSPLTIQLIPELDTRSYPTVIS